MKPLISIIVPVYNVEGYIERCLISLMAQTYTNLEIIIVNDGSVDRSIEIAEALVVKDKRVKIIDQPNLGLGEARNTGIRHEPSDLGLFEVKVLKTLKTGLFLERLNGKLPNIFFKVVGRILQYYSK